MNKVHIPCGLLGALSIWFALLSPTTAQVDRMQYRHWTWLEQRRRQLLADTMELTAVRRAEVAKALRANQEKNPPLTMARAIAAARGVDADGPFCFRAGLQVFALPEVIADKRQLSVTVWAAYSGLTGALPAPKSFAFAIRVLDAKGQVVRQGEIAATGEIRDLREFRCCCKLDVAKLPEAEYRVEVDSILDDKSPRPRDLPLTTTFAVLHSYPKRAAKFRLDGESQDFLAGLRKLDPLPRAVLQGAAEFGSRAWYGIPGIDPSHTIEDLLRAELIEANVREKRFLLQGVKDAVTIALPVVGETDDQHDATFVSLRLPPEGLPEKDSPGWQRLAARPLVIFVADLPSLDHEHRRPGYPHFALPNFLMAQLDIAGFDSERKLQLAVVESPGRMKNTRRGLSAVLAQLAAVFPFDANRLVLVGVGAGASGVVDVALKQTEQVRGIVLVNGIGTLAAPQLRKLGEMPVLAIAGGNRLAKVGIDLLQRYAEHAEREVEIRDEPGLPWCLATPLSVPEINAFVHRTVKRGG